jgi:hypothetical protein
MGGNIMYKNIMNYVCEMVEDFEAIEIVENFECLAYNITIEYDSKFLCMERNTCYDYRMSALQ